MRNTQLPTIIATIFSFLNENVEYAVLRNYDGLPTKNKSCLLYTSDAADEL